MEIKKLIEKHDTQNQFKVLIESFRQIEYAWENKVDIDSSLVKNINNIIVAVMGGSAISADLLKYKYLTSSNQEEDHGRK